jgi:Mg2+ and Co2+ transporter CorA
MHEAGKSKKVNYYIIVFTLVTVFFLPLTFVTVS